MVSLVGQGMFFSCGCLLQEGDIVSHPTSLLGDYQSCLPWHAGLGSLPPPKHFRQA